LARVNGKDELAEHMMRHVKKILLLVPLIIFKGEIAFGQCPNLCAAPSQNPLQKIVLKFSDDAIALAQTLTKQGFKCNSPKATFERGYRCRGTVTGYPQPVNIYIPPQFQKRSQVPLALHLHGHNFIDPESSAVHFNISSGNGDYGKMLAKSGANSLLVIPESLGNCDTYKNYFKKPTDLDQLLKSVEEKTGLGTSRLSLSSHSGGDRTMDLFASWYLSGNPGEALAKTQNIGLFDSLYGQRKSLAAWPGALRTNDPSSQFYCAYVAAGSTAKHLNWLKQQAPPSEKQRYRPVRTEHMSIMRDGGFSEYLKTTDKAVQP
jgi:hypothetical protein